VNPEQIVAACTELARAQGLGDDQLHLTFSGPEQAYAGDRASPVVRAFTTAIRAQGGTPRLKVKTGTSDMNVVGPVWRCPIIAYGPGDSRLDHTPDEHLSIQEYLQSINVLSAGIEQLARELAP
jgi:LysW-gamma-L-lysine carboxypeptidase